MRTTYPIAFIGPQDYRRIQSIIGSASLPGSYDEWLADHAIQKERWDRRGFDVLEIQVLPDELIRYGEVCGKHPTVPMLSLLAVDKARGWTS